MMEAGSGISVIVPTYRRLAALRKALESLQSQTMESFEILVADNSNDAAIHQAVTEFNRSARVPARYIPEPELGLHNARHAGARAARGDILVFTDDDATFDKGWLRAYADAFAAHPDMAAAGGPVRPVWEAPPPAWLRDYIGTSKVYGILSLMDLGAEFRMAPDVFFFGVNMAIRRETLFRVGGFNPELIGARTIGNGESGLIVKLRREGFALGYVPGALVLHHIPTHRMTVQYIRKWAWHLGGAVMYERWQGKAVSMRELAADGVRIVRMQGRAMLQDIVVRDRTDREGIDTQFQASMGWCMLNYLWWMLVDPLVKNSLSTNEPSL